MLGNTATMGILALYFCIVFGYEYTKIKRRKKNFVKSCQRGFVVNDGILHVPTSISIWRRSSDSCDPYFRWSKIIDGWEMAGGVTRLGNDWYFYCKLWLLLRWKFTAFCVKEKYLHQNAWYCTNWCFKFIYCIDSDCVDCFSRDRDQRCFSSFRDRYLQSHCDSL